MSGRRLPVLSRAPTRSMLFCSSIDSSSVVSSDLGTFLLVVLRRSRGEAGLVEAAGLAALSWKGQSRFGTRAVASRSDAQLSGQCGHQRGANPQAGTVE